jgi:hypothetical protein
MLPPAEAPWDGGEILRDGASLFPSEEEYREAVEGGEVEEPRK